MTRCQSSFSASLLLLALLSVAPQPGCAASPPPIGSSHGSTLSGRHDSRGQQGAQAAVSGLQHGATRTHRRDDIHAPAASEHSSLPSADENAAWALAAVLTDSMDHLRKEMGVRDDNGGRATGSVGAPGELEHTQDQGKEEESVEALREEVNMAARELVDYGARTDESAEEERDQRSTVNREGGEVEGKKEVEERKEEEREEERMEERGFEKQVDDVVEAASKTITDTDGSKLQRETRGYFQNIDLGLQDNEILPPLKGYKAYNQQLAQATKKLKWQEEKTKGPAAAYERNFMDDFDVPEQAVEEEEEEALARAREDEEARARAEQEEMRRQQAEAEAARDEEQRLADIASDMLMQYMDRKQQTSYMKQRQKASVLGNAAEDKRSNEVESDDGGGDLELETIDRLIEISSKLHLPADDVVEIISNVEEKKRRKDEPTASVPRFRPLVAPPRPQSPLYKYPPAPKISKPVKSVNPYKKWYKEKGKSKVFKQDYWFKPAKQFMAYPSYPYYQKPYRAYYPVYFPPPKPRLYSKPAFAYDYNFEDSLDYGIKPPKRRNMNKLKGKGQSWKLMALSPPAPYIPNYILPHPRTYYSLPVPKPPQPPPNRRPSPSHYYPPDYDSDGVAEQQESDEELENFIEKMYFHRRIF
ncbi:hypothetical protein ACEWY4_009107 [Coilia grayii]|uniref:Neurosecretory protein VGF-like n=1 Tax=Coilia grayii TaxID=363190 RepID=A0ABD1K5H9_9TELE